MDDAPVYTILVPFIPQQLSVEVVNFLVINTQINWTARETDDKLLGVTRKTYWQHFLDICKSELLPSCRWSPGQPYRCSARQWGRISCWWGSRRTAAASPWTRSSPPRACSSSRCSRSRSGHPAPSGSSCSVSGGFSPTGWCRPSPPSRSHSQSGVVRTSCRTPPPRASYGRALCFRGVELSFSVFSVFCENLATSRSWNLYQYGASLARSLNVERFKWSTCQANLSFFLISFFGG